jgi:hypothetical protein
MININHKENIMINALIHLLCAFLLAATIAVGATILTLWHTSSDCEANGGNFTIEGATAWCRY